MKQKERRIKHNKAVANLNIDKTQLQMHTLIDYDEKYLKDINADPEAKAFLAKFTDEYYNAAFWRKNTHGEDLLLASDKAVKEEYRKIKKDKVKYSQFQEELFKENQGKVEGFPRFKAQAYKRFCKLVETQDPKELVLLNKYAKSNYKLPLKMEDWVSPEEVDTPKKYRVSDPLTFLKDKVKRERANIKENMKGDIVARDYSNSRGVTTEGATSNLSKYSNDFLDLIAQKRPDLVSGFSQVNTENEDLVDMFLVMEKNESLDLFVEDVFYDEFANFISFEKDLVFKTKMEDFVKEAYEKRKKNKLTKVMYFWHLCIANFAILTFLSNQQRTLGNVLILDKIFNKKVFKYKKDNNKNMVLDIPKEFLSDKD